MIMLSFLVVPASRLSLRTTQCAALVQGVSSGRVSGPPADICSGSGAVSESFDTLLLGTDGAEGATAATADAVSSAAEPCAVIFEASQSKAVEPKCSTRSAHEWYYMYMYLGTYIVWLVRETGCE